MLEKLTELSAELGPIAAIAFVILGYVVITIDRSRAGSPSKDDTQVGLKLVLYGLVIAGVQMVAQGLAMFLGFALGGFKGGGGPVRVAMPPIIVGGVIVFGVLKALLPRTNTASHRQCERFLLGALGIELGVLAIAATDQMLTNLFVDGSWSRTSDMLAIAAVDGALAVFAITRFGAIAGWTMPVAPPPPAPPQYPPPGFPPPQGFPPPGGGYGGGTPPPGGGYPPQGGGNPYAPR